MVKHIVLTRFTDPAEQVPIARAMLEALKEQIPEIVSLELGADFLGSPRSFDMALSIVFSSREALERYTVHPAHRAVQQYIHAHRNASACVDYEYDA